MTDEDGRPGRAGPDRHQGWRFRTSPTTRCWSCKGIRAGGKSATRTEFEIEFFATIRRMTLILQNSPGRRLHCPSRARNTYKSEYGTILGPVAHGPRSRNTTVLFSNQREAVMTKCGRRKIPALHSRYLTLIALLPSEATMPDWVNCQQGVT